MGANEKLGRKLLALKEEIQEYINEYNRKEGELNAIKKQLKEEFKFNSLKEAKEYLKEVDNEIEKLNESVKKITLKIEEELNEYRD